MPERNRFSPRLYAMAAAVASMLLAAPLMAQSQQQKPDILAKDVATCLEQARTALGPNTSNDDRQQIDAYTADGRIFFNNPFVSQNPTFAFWKCIRLKGYKVDG